MSCGCDKTNCGCNTEDLQVKEVAIVQPCIIKQPDVPVGGYGRFFDVLMEDFVVPNVGSEAYFHVKKGSLWTQGIWFAVNLPNNKYAVFKVTNAGQIRLKVLNGLDKSGTSNIVGNPAPGTVIKSGSIIFPVVPAGDDTEFSTKVLNILINGGTDTIIEILKESDSLCLTNIPLLEDADGDAHLFGGTRDDCNCEYGSEYVSNGTSCLRKLMNLFTGQSGRTICAPLMAITDSSEVNGQKKRFIVANPSTGCFQKWKTIDEINSCSSIGEVPLSSTEEIGAVVVCHDGNRKTLAAKKGYAIYPVPVNPDEPAGSYIWKYQPSGLHFFPLGTPQILASGAGTFNVSCEDFPHNNCYAIFETELVGAGDPNWFITIDGRKIAGVRVYAAVSGEAYITSSVPIKLVDKDINIVVNYAGSSVTTFSLKLIGYMAYHPYQGT